MGEVILSIDCGTQSLRGLLFSSDGTLLEKSKIPYKPYYSLQSGWAEQDPEIFWRSLCTACKSLKEKNSLLFKKIDFVQE